MKKTKALKQTVNICLLLYRFLKDDADITVSIKGEGYAHDLVNTPEGFTDDWEEVDLGF